MSSLENKSAVVTGGSGAIGSAIIAGLEQQGARALSLDAVRPAAAAPFQGCDVDASVAAAIAKVQQAYGRLDLVVHAAGVSREAGNMQTCCRELGCCAKRELARGGKSGGRIRRTRGRGRLRRVSLRTRRAADHRADSAR